MKTQRSIERAQKKILSNTLTKTAVIALADWIEDEKRKAVASGVIPAFYSGVKECGAVEDVLGSPPKAVIVRVSLNQNNKPVRHEGPWKTNQK